MIVSSVDLDDFVTYRDTQLRFPPAGLVVLTGTNGAGKSTVLESIAWTIWGETIRGSDVPPGRVGIQLAGGPKVIRLRSKKASSLTMFDADGKDASGQTATETQAKINQRLGDWRLFCATRVFSRELLSRFGNATNKERQALLESILGLEQFTRSEKVTRSELATRRQLEAEALSDVRTHSASLARSREAGDAKFDPGLLAAVRKKIGALVASQGPLVAPRLKLADRSASLSRMYEKASSALVAKRAEDRGLVDQIAKLQAKAESGGSLDSCPVCLRAVGAGDQRAIAKHCRDEMAPLSIRAGKLGQEIALLEADLADQLSVREKLREEEMAMDDTLRAQASEETALKRQLAVLESQEKAHQKIAEMVAKDEAALAAAEAHAETTRIDVNVAAAAVEALGPRGARVRLFDGALNRLEIETNDVLARLGLGITVRFSAKKVQASGKEVDEVSMKIEGDCGDAYLKTSGGERTRIDVAMLLALARMSGSDGILMFDEIFDPLDDDGLERVRDLLTEMAIDRQILVTSHNPRLVSLIPRSSVWEVSKVAGTSKVTVG